MKKILVCMSLFFCSTYGNLTLAAKPTLCIALNNLSHIAVEFSTAADPGWIPVVQSNSSYTLNGDFMQGCLSNSCNIFITPKDGNKYTIITSVPKGSRIIYSNPNQYSLDVNAGVRCP